MYIKNIKIGHFKKLKKIDIELGQINVIIGKNNVGKSTLINVINSFLKKDIKIFKNSYDEGQESFEIELVTNEGKWILNETKATPKWEFLGDDNITKDYYSAFVNAHTTHEEILKILQNGVAGYIASAAKESVDTIKRQLEGYEYSTDLDHTTVISEEYDDFSFEKKFDLSKAIKIDFPDSKNSIKNKGLGQQKEFVLNQFSKDNPLEVNILLIDEIENSLSMEAVKDIINGFKREDIIDGEYRYPAEESLQVIYSTHNSFAITKESTPNIISLGGNIPKGIINNLKDEVFCEGPSDAKAFQAVFPGTLFIPGGGSNISNVIKSIVTQGAQPKVIVDGDKPGIGYFNKIKSLLPSRVHKLKLGTIEDYVIKIEKNQTLSLLCYSGKSPNILENMPNSSEADKNLKSKVKGELQKRNIDKNILRNELKYLIDM